MANDAQLQREPALRSLAAACASGQQTAIANVNFDTARATEPGTYRRHTCLESTRWSLSRFCFDSQRSENCAPRLTWKGRCAPNSKLNRATQAWSYASGHNEVICQKT